ncbi:hypothetical protein EXE10_16965, partial [Acinetobacter sp. WCHAc060033]
MNNQWMKKTLLAVSIQFAIGSLYAAETAPADIDVSPEVATDQAEAVATDSAGAVSDGAATEAIKAEEATQTEAIAPAKEEVKINKDETKSLAPKAGTQAAEALQKQEGDASQETNLQEVFTSNERQYSLIKKGEISTFYDLDYSY